MSMTWNIRVEKQWDGFMSLGYNPTTNATLEEAENTFKDFMYDWFPDHSFWCALDFHNEMNGGMGEFHFSAGSFTPYVETSAVLIAMTHFIYNNFSFNEGIDMMVYFA